MKNFKTYFLNFIYTACPAVVLVFIDALIKKWAYTSLYKDHNGRLDFIDGFLGFVYAENTGAAWSMLSDQPWIFVSVSLIMVCAIFIYLIFGKNNNFLFRLSMTLFMSGGIGNLVDRLFRTGSHFGNRNGYVVDMLNFEFIDFPIFNFADVLVCCGATIFVLYFLIYEIKNDKVADQNGR